jgi:hypothetical protein
LGRGLERQVFRSIAFGYKGMVKRLRPVTQALKADRFNARGEDVFTDPEISNPKNGIEILVDAGLDEWRAFCWQKSSDFDLSRFQYSGRRTRLDAFRDVLRRNWRWLIGKGEILSISNP